MERIYDSVSFMDFHFPAAERRNYKDSIRRAHVAPPAEERRMRQRNADAPTR